MQSARRRDLSRSDFTLLVVGAVIGADIYVVASMGASSLGPAQLFAWLVAGVLAVLIAIAFVQCSAIDQNVGGSYSYARQAFGPFLGFLAGWALYIGEWIALPVFPLAFSNYLAALVPGIPSSLHLVTKIVLIAIVTISNLLGVRQGARLNDFLTLAKLLPLAIFILFGLAFLFLRSSQVSGNLHPFAPLGWGGLGAAVLPIFWAYAGFELAVLPAGEVRNPEATLPFGLIVGMGVAIAFYLLTALVVVASLPWQEAAASSSPLAAALQAVTRSLAVPEEAGRLLMGIGAMISIAGVYVVFTLGVARLGFALAKDGLFPGALGHINRRNDTPDIGLLFQAIFALIGATFLDLRGLITIAVFFLGITYFLTACAALRLVKQNPAKRLHLPGLELILILAAVSAIFLVGEAPLRQIVVGSAVMMLGAALFAWRSGEWRKTSELEAELEATEQGLLNLEHHVHAWLLRSISRVQRRPL